MWRVICVQLLLIINCIHTAETGIQSSADIITETLDFKAVGLTVSKPIITMCNGPLIKMIERRLKLLQDLEETSQTVMIKANLKPNPHIIICVDRAAYAACKRANIAHCLIGGLKDFIERYEMHEGKQAGLYHSLVFAKVGYVLVNFKYSMLNGGEYADTSTVNHAMTYKFIHSLTINSLYV